MKHVKSFRFPVIMLLLLLDAGVSFAQEAWVGKVVGKTLPTVVTALSYAQEGIFLGAPGNSHSPEFIALRVVSFVKKCGSSEAKKEG